MAYFITDAVHKSIVSSFDTCSAVVLDARGRVTAHGQPCAHAQAVQQPWRQQAFSLAVQAPQPPPPSLLDLERASSAYAGLEGRVVGVPGAMQGTATDPLHGFSGLAPGLSADAQVWPDTISLIKD